MSGTGGYLGQARTTLTTIPAWRERQGYPADKRFHWAYGRKMRDLAYDRSGLIPIKDNAPKTFKATGSHPMVYHESAWLDRELGPLAEEYFAERDRQGELFSQFGAGVEPELYFPPEPNGEHDGSSGAGVHVELEL
jgi:hypothetical protein